MSDNYSASSMLQLHDGSSMPIFGLGTYRSSCRQTEDAVEYALKHGCRLVDTASIYDNEAAVGAALKRSQVRREDIFISTKLWPDDLCDGSCVEACEKSLAKLGVDYIDLYLLHSPLQIIACWDAMIEVQRRGMVRAIGVSNFSVTHLKVLAERYPQNLPVVNQIEMHPLIWRTRREVLDWCSSHQIVVMAYGSLFSGQQQRMQCVAAEIAKAHHRTEAQILLRWAVQMGFSIIPKSVHEERIKSNIDIFDFRLTGDEMSILSSFEQESLNEYWNPLEWPESVSVPPQARNSVNSSKRKRVSACLSLVAGDNETGEAIVEALNAVSWPERALEWHHWKALTGKGCGFDAGDLFPESSKSFLNVTEWVNFSSAQMVHSRGTHVICVSFEIGDADNISNVAAMLLERMRLHFASSVSLPLLHRARVLLLSGDPRIPFLPLKDGLASLHLHKKDLTVSAACTMLDTAGMFVIPSALDPNNVAALNALVMARIQDAEQALEAEGEDIGSGDFIYSEIYHRGKDRWDLSLYKHGEAVGNNTVAANDPRLESLKRAATSELWTDFLRTLLGCYHWEAGVVCSRPGARGQGWHADASPSKYRFEGTTGSVQSVCIFIPLVSLDSPSLGQDDVATFGRGCTGFWPGSHRYPECGCLGAGAAEHLEAAVLGAPLAAGDALVYDTRIVHSGTPNDATHLKGLSGYRPILQLTYWPEGSRRENSYGYFQLFSD